MTIPLITLAAALVAAPDADVYQPPIASPAVEHRAESPWKISVAGGPMVGGTALYFVGVYDGATGGGAAFSVHALNHRWHSFASGSLVLRPKDELDRVDRGAFSSLTTGTGVRLDTHREGSTGFIFDIDGALGAAMLGTQFRHLGLGFRTGPGLRFATNWTLQASWILTTSIITWETEAGINLGYMF